jgi:hypothetical protein
VLLAANTTSGRSAAESEKAAANKKHNESVGSAGRTSNEIIMGAAWRLIWMQQIVYFDCDAPLCASRAHLKLAQKEPFTFTSCARVCSGTTLSVSGLSILDLCQSSMQKPC